MPNSRKTRADLGIPEEGDSPIDYDELLGDTPIYTLYTLVRQQLLAFPAYMCTLISISGPVAFSMLAAVFNVSGQKFYVNDSLFRRLSRMS